jgi:hypothetical protein
MPTNTIERRTMMYAITGITGKVGGELARTFFIAKEIDYTPSQVAVNWSRQQAKTDIKSYMLSKNQMD